MKPQLVAGALGALVLVLAPAIASAQPQGERTYLQQGVPAPAQAFELTVATGYTQGFGMFQQGVGMPQVARAGIGVDLGAGYRIDPHWGVSLGGQYQELQPERADATRGVSTTAAVQYHFDPTTRLDPWLELGAGYRFLYQVPVANTPTALTHGLQLARARLGFDLRVSPEVAIAPVIGADATVFLFQDVPGLATNISDPSVSTFVFAGLQGRMDIGGTKVGRATVTSAQPSTY